MSVKIIKISQESIRFSDGTLLTSEHDQDCCEQHYLSLGDITMEEVEDLKFDLSNDSFFTRIPDYGISLNPIKGWPVRIPGYGSNNGYYSDNLTLQLSLNGEVRTFDITDCQTQID